MPARDALRGVLSLLAPARCAACDLLLTPTEDGFCTGCAALLDPVRRTDRRPTAAQLYGGPLAEAIQRLKYQGRTDLAPVLGALLVRAALDHGGEVDRVIPMPLHPARLRARGFNQATLLARPVARALGVSLDTRTLRRVRDTSSQAGLERRDRLRNVRGAFAARVDRPGRVLLIDDVRTTGATLTAAASALLAAGHLRVQTLALARADL